MDEKTKRNIDTANFLINDSLGRKILLAGGVLLALYSSTFLLRGTAKLVSSYKELKQAIKS